MTRRSRYLAVGALCAISLAGLGQVAQASTSSQVAMIGSGAVINGGQLPTTVSGYTFTDLAPGNVNATNLAAFDTAVLNVASPQLWCNVDNLSAASKADLVSWVESGNKLIIYDSECPTQNYGWLPVPFTTSNPGAYGATGTLTIVQDTPLGSSDPTSPYYVDAAGLGSYTDAVGDANVMTTQDPNWCLSMSATNVLGVTGPTVTYAAVPAGSDTGLIIYDGLDVDLMPWGDIPNGLGKMWENQLAQEFNPSDLPCISVVGITLSPETAENEVGTPHTVVATMTDQLGEPQVGVDVAFEVKSGPNAGDTGSATTDANGEAAFTYTGDGGEGTDTIGACFTNSAGQQICAADVEKVWVITNQNPDCSAAVPSIETIWAPNHKFVPVNILGVTDPDGDDVSITITSIMQDEPVNTVGDGSTGPDGKGVGTSVAEVRAERTGTPRVPGNGRVYHIAFEASDGLGGTCTSEVLVGVPHDRARPATDDGPLYDSTVAD